MTEQNLPQEDIELTTKTKPSDVFETEWCDRCVGIGRLQMTMRGTKCVRCNGKGKKYTARGKRQLDAYKAHLVDNGLGSKVEALRVGLDTK